MFIVKYRNLFLALSAFFGVVAIAFILIFGLRQGVEFTGGATFDVLLSEDASVEEVLALVTDMSPEETTITTQSVGDQHVVIRTSELEDSLRVSIGEEIQELAGVTLEKTSSVGPTIGDEMRSKSIIAIILVTVSIIIFIAFAFRQVSHAIPSWAYGGATTISQIYDILITVGVFALFGYLFGAELDSLFVIAILTVIGYSINDTIIVFDRIREKLSLNKEKNIQEDFNTVVGKSVNETITRSINTSLTTSLALIALYIFGGQPTEIFSLTLLAGVISGTYSSLFLAVPVLLLFNEIQEKKGKVKVEEKED